MAVFVLYDRRSRGGLPTDSELYNTQQHKNGEGYCVGHNKLNRRKHQRKVFSVVQKDFSGLVSAVYHVRRFGARVKVSITEVIISDHSEAWKQPRLRNRILHVFTQSLVISTRTEHKLFWEGSRLTGFFFSDECLAPEKSAHHFLTDFSQQLFYKLQVCFTSIYIALYFSSYQLGSGTVSVIYDPKHDARRFTKALQTLLENCIVLISSVFSESCGHFAGVTS